MSLPIEVLPFARWYTDFNSGIKIMSEALPS
jgi:hypothetical protein